MGLYIQNADVEIRLVGKVRFTDNDEEENKMSRRFLARLINEAEGQVELDLSPRYEVPFQTADGRGFMFLPDRPTRNILRTLCEVQSVSLVLDTDFGRGSVVDADKYCEALRKRYKQILADLLAKKQFEGDAQAGLGWAKPPMTNLMLSYFNTEADDGFAGMVLNSSRTHGYYTEEQINNPAESFWNSFANSGPRQW